MAPRVFVSSTFHDLYHVRETVGMFIRQFGFDEVMFENGQIPYGITTSVENDCYEEIQFCDIFVSIVGPRFGSHAYDQDYSISQKELLVAMKLQLPIYVFVEKNILNEYYTYKWNKTNNIHFAHVEDRRIYLFLEQLYLSKPSIPIFSFENASEIVDVLHKQWVSLFERFLWQHNKNKSQNDSLSTASQAQVVKQHASLVSLRLQELLQLNVPVVFSTLEELSNFLNTLGFQTSNLFSSESHFEWGKYEDGWLNILKVAKCLFDEKLCYVHISPEKWSDHFIELERWQMERKKRE